MLANALQIKLSRLLGQEPRLAERIDVRLNAIGLRLYVSHAGPSAVEGHKFALHFLVTEWEQVVDACNWTAWRRIAMLRGSAGRRVLRTEAQGFMVHL
jgi:hypothetical protein